MHHRHLARGLCRVFHFAGVRIGPRMKRHGQTPVQVEYTCKRLTFALRMDGDRMFPAACKEGV